MIIAILGEHVWNTLQLKKHLANLRNAPAIYQGSVFSSDTQGGIHAVDMSTGKHVWFTNLSKPIGQDNGNLATFWEKLRCFGNLLFYGLFKINIWVYLILFDMILLLVGIFPKCPKQTRRKNYKLIHATTFAMRICVSFLRPLGSFCPGFTMVHEGVVLSAGDWRQPSPMGEANHVVTAIWRKQWEDVKT